MKRLVLLGLYFTLSLVLVLGTAFFSSPGAFADDMGGTMDGGGGGDDGNDMPQPEDAPATTDALTAGGGGSDDDENNDNSGGSEDDENSDSGGDKHENNDKDDPQIPDDAPATTNALTAIECPKGQEVALFSTSCVTDEGAEIPRNSGDTTLAATSCTAGITPNSFVNPDELSVTNAVWKIDDNDFETKTELRDKQQTLLHKVATPVKPPLTSKDLISNPGLLAHCTGKPVDTTNPDGSKSIYRSDGTISTANLDGTTTETTPSPDGTTSIATFTGQGDSRVLTNVDKYNADNRITSSDRYDPSSDISIKVQTDEYVAGTKNIISETKYNPINGNLTVKTEYVPGYDTIIGKTKYNPNTGRLIEKIEYDPDSGQTTRKTLYDIPGAKVPYTGKPQMVGDFQINKNCDRCPQKVIKITTYPDVDGNRYENDRIKDVTTKYDKDGQGCLVKTQHGIGCRRRSED